MQLDDKDRQRWRSILLILGGWTLVGLVLAAQAWLAMNTRATPVPLARTLAVWLAWAYLWALLTPLALGILARWPLKGAGWLVHLGASGLLTFIELALFSLAAPYIGALSDGGSWWVTMSTLVATTGLLNIPVYWLIVGVTHALQVRRAAREREQRELMLVAELGEARLQALRAQLQPHFLFNALNTIAVLMHEDVQLAHRTLLQLSHLLRRALESSATPMVSLGEELAFLRAYMDIEATRFEGRISYLVDVDATLLDLQVPGLLLQPLVENALHHGLARQGRQSRITVEARRDGETLHILVRDNGRGLAEALTEGVGLSNTRKRLDILYGKRHRFELLPAEGGGTLARLVLPL